MCTTNWQKLDILKEYIGICYMLDFQTNNWVIFITPHYCRLLLFWKPNDGPEGVPFNESEQIYQKISMTFKDSFNHPQVLSGI